MDSKTSDNNEIKRYALIALFITSYIPLFIIISLRQISDNSNYLHWGGFCKTAFYCFLSKFGLAAILIIISTVGVIGSAILFSNIREDADNGDNVIITKVKNRNNESIGYISTYIIPFINNSFNTWVDYIIFIGLMLLIYHIYIRSNMILVNPILNLKYSLIEFEYKRYDNCQIYNGIMITKNKGLDIKSKIKIYKIGFNLYYGK